MATTTVTPGRIGRVTTYQVDCSECGPLDTQHTQDAAELVGEVHEEYIHG